MRLPLTSHTTEVIALSEIKTHKVGIVMNGVTAHGHEPAPDALHRGYHPAGRVKISYEASSRLIPSVGRNPASWSASNTRREGPRT